MRKNLYLYGLVVVCALIQVISARYIGWFPDLVLLVVIFSGVFQGVFTALAVGLVAGVFQGCFSVTTGDMDIFLFPVLGLVSSALSRLFYRYNPAAQIFIVLSVLVTALAVRVYYLNLVSGSELEMPYVLIRHWKNILADIIVAPVFFIFIKDRLHIKET